MNAEERIYLHKVGRFWIDLSKIEYLEPSPYVNATTENGSTVHMDSGARIVLSGVQFQDLMDKLDAWHLLAS